VFLPEGGKPMIFLAGAHPTLVVAFLIGLFSAFSISKIGFRIGLADVPNERSSHQRPVPRSGGVGIPLAAALAALTWTGRIEPFLIAALAVSFIALLTDFHELPVKLRFLLQFVLAGGLVWLYKLELLELMVLQYGIWIVILVVLILVLFIVAGTNFFNFMDGINGIAGFQGVLAFGFLGVFALFFKGTENIALLSLVVSAAALGFLFLNFPNARVFMGDVGSIFLGFLFCGFAIILFGDIKEFLVLALFNGVFYVDCVSTVLLRLYRRENVLQAHRKHLYQELVHKKGWPHYKVTLAYAAVQFAVGVGALWLLKLSVIYAVLAWVILFAVYWGVRRRFGFFG
jgi:Fuc2NAc and GlcNAc transferase